MITCLTWVKRGIPKEIPDRVELSREELEELICETKDKIKEKSQEETNNSEKATIREEDEKDELTEYDFEHYDDEEDGTIMSGAGMAGLAYYASNEDDPYITLKNTEDDERDDFLIKSTDNMIVVGKMEEDFSNLEVYVYNEEEGNHYVHHDIMLESFPLAIEWMSFDPGPENKSGNYIAVGTMEPHIDVWDLDIVNTLESVFTLGKRKKKKKKKHTNDQDIGHTDAVLGLSWNHNIRNVLASGSADSTVILWDMAERKCVHTLRHHKNKVQCVKWHPYEGQSLLTGSFDKSVHVLDCRNPETCAKKWKLGGEIEQVLWNHFSPFHFLASTDNGNIFYCDVRSDSPVFQISAHDDAVTGMALSTQIPGCLVTSSSDKIVKVWDFKEGKPAFVMSRDVKMGRIHCTEACPDAAFVFALGGEKDGLRILDLMETAGGKEHFAKRERIVLKQEDRKQEEEKQDAKQEPMESEAAAQAMASLSMKDEREHNKEIIKKKKKKKKKFYP